MDSYRNGHLQFDVLDEGPADGELVVLLHGFPQFNDSWAAVSKRLVDAGYRTVAPNQRGYSPGARPARRRDYAAPKLVGDVVALIDALGADRVHLVGHDWGAAVAWSVAQACPDRLRSLTALSVPHPAAFLGSMFGRQLAASWYMGFFQLPRIPERLMLGPAGSPTRMERFLIKSGQTPELARRDVQAMAGTGAFPFALNWYRAIPLVNPRRTRTKVDVATLYIWSDGDTALLRKGAERCGEWVTGPYQFDVMSGVSHWIPDEEPDRAADLILEHLRKN